MLSDGGGMVKEPRDFIARLSVADSDFPLVTIGDR
jgi:hypothetical protein